MHVERAVRERYSQAAGQRVDNLCCAVDYDAAYLEQIPGEILERDYGCGDPSRYLRSGEVVLDLGSGGGKICYIASQVVGARGRVIGVDMNDEMLALAESHRRAFGERVGYQNIEFRKGKIQDLALDYAALEVYLAQHPVTNVEELEHVEAWKAEQRERSPLIATGSIDVIVSNCVLNLVRPADKRALFSEMHRVLADGGRAVISDIVCDEEIPREMAEDPDLWAGCISGAFLEEQFLDAFLAAGFQGVRILRRDEKPWQTVRGIEFRALTVEAFRPAAGPCLERNQAVIYTGPWSRVTDDDGHTFVRGRRMAVCDKTFRFLTREPYGDQIVPVEPYAPVAPEAAQPFTCDRDGVRDPRQTKGQDYDRTQAAAGDCCAPGDEGCC